MSHGLATAGWFSIARQAATPVVRLPGSLVDVRIRPMRRGDLPAIVHACAAAADHDRHHGPRRQAAEAAFGPLPPEPAPRQEDAWLRRLEQLAPASHVAESEGEVVGYAVAEVDDERRKRPYSRRRIVPAGNLCVAPQARGMGLGRSLLLSQLRRLREHGVRHALLRIEPADPAHQGLARLGPFVPACRRLVFAAPADRLIQGLGDVPGVVVSGEETLVPALVHRLRQLLEAKRHALHALASLEGFAQAAGVEPPTPAEQEEAVAALARQMLREPSRVIASHDSVHVCLTHDGHLYVSDDFPCDFAAAVLRRHAAALAQAEPGRLVTISVAAEDAYAIEVLRCSGLAQVGEDLDAISTLAELA